MATDDPIRASDNDREVVVAALRDAYTAGRLTMEEFDERTSAAYQARTWGELRKLTIDLPTQPILGADVPGRRWSAAGLPPAGLWPGDPSHEFPADELPSDEFQSPQLPSHPPRNNLPPRPPVRRRRPGVMLIPLAVWLLLIAHTSGSVGPIAIVVTVMVVFALLSAGRRR
jgi:hypothetical protein